MSWDPPEVKAEELDDGVLNRVEITDPEAAQFDELRSLSNHGNVTCSSGDERDSDG